jgi:hypothetical protein
VLAVLGQEFPGIRLVGVDIEQKQLERRLLCELGRHLDGGVDELTHAGAGMCGGRLCSAPPRALRAWVRLTFLLS